MERCCRDQLEQREEDREREAAHQEEARRERSPPLARRQLACSRGPRCCRRHRVAGRRSSVSRLRQTKMRTMPTSVRLMDSPAQSPMTPQPRPNAAKAATGRPMSQWPTRLAQHGRARVAQPAQCARRHALQAVEQLERRRDRAATRRPSRRRRHPSCRDATRNPGTGKKRECRRRHEAAAERDGGPARAPRPARLDGRSRGRRAPLRPTRGRCGTMNVTLAMLSAT